MFSKPKGLGLVCVLGAWIANPAFSLNLKELQAELAKRPDVKWVAGETGVVESLGINKGKSVPFGLIEEKTAFEVLPGDFDTPADAPSKLDWRNKDNINWISSIKNQAFCGSCVAFAAVSALEAQFNITSGIPNLNLDLSEQHLFANIGGCDSGSWPGYATSSLKSKGTPDEVCFPYVSGRLGEDQDISLSCKDNATRSYKITSSTSVSASQAKAALQHGPLMTTMTVYEDFMFYKGGVYEHVTGDVAGGHAITIVGYDDENQAWIVKNSWGESWGEKGFFRIKYTDVSGVGNSNYRMDVANAGVLAKLAEPIYLDAVKDEIVLKGEKLFDKNLKEMTYKINNRDDSTQVAEGSFNLSDMESVLQTRSLKDGVYDVQINAKAEDNSAGRPWYSTFFIANEEQHATIELKPDFDNTAPVTARVYFIANINYDKVPLTSLEIYFKKNDNTGEIPFVTSSNPGKGVKVGWRTPTYPNGTYEVYAIGKIGKFYQFKSNSLTVTVQN